MTLSYIYFFRVESVTEEVTDTVKKEVVDLTDRSPIHSSYVILGFS